MDLRLGDPDERRHGVVVVEKHVNLDSTLRTSVVRPREQRQAERDGRRIEREQYVLRHRPEACEEFVEEILEKSRRTMLVDEAPKRSTSRSIHSEAEDDSQKDVRRSPAYCIGQRASFWRSPDSQVDEFSVAAGQAVDDLPEGIRPCKVTEEHRYELGPGSEALGAKLCLMFDDQFFKVHGGKDLRKDLTEKTRYLYHHDASVFRDVVALADMMISQNPGAFSCPQKAILDKSDRLYHLESR